MLSHCQVYDIYSDWFSFLLYFHTIILRVCTANFGEKKTCIYAGDASNFTAEAACIHMTGVGTGPADPAAAAGPII